MINRIQFNGLLSYLKARPNEAERMREALGIKAEEEPKVEWITATEAGTLIGKSAKWVKEHLVMFPSARRVQQGTRYAYLFDKSEVALSYENFINQKTIEE